MKIAKYLKAMNLFILLRTGRKKIFAIILFTVLSIYTIMTFTSENFIFFNRNHHLNLIPDINPCHQLEDVELFLRTFHGRQLLYKYVFVKSLSIFWTCRNKLKLLVILDNESKLDHDWGDSIAKEFPFPRVIYENPGSIYHDNGHIRQQVSMFYADKYTDAKYVAFVDTDTLFVTSVTPGLLFQNGKPVIIGQYGLDNVYWEDVAANTEKWFGHKEIMKGMSYFPVIIKVEHLVKLRNLLERKHNMTFDEIFKKFTFGDYFSQFTIMCQFVWMFYRDDYSFHFQPIPHDNYEHNYKFKKISTSKALPSYYKENLKTENYIPKPRSSIHWSYPQPNPLSAVDLSEKWLETFIEGGFCYSIGLNYCPEKCKMHNFGKIQERLYLFEGYNWSWHPLALQQQQKHYEEVHGIINYLRDNKLSILGFKSTEDACEKWPEGYNFTYPKGKVSSRHFTANEDKTSVP